MEEDLAAQLTVFAALMGKVPMKAEPAGQGETKWTASVAFEASGPVEYKYMLKHRETLEVLSWEAIPGNRTLSVSTEKNVALYVFAG